MTGPAAPFRADAGVRAAEFDRVTRAMRFILWCYGQRGMRGLAKVMARQMRPEPRYWRLMHMILARYHGVRIGDYSYGAILHPFVLPRGSVVGRYCSVGMGLVVRRRDHPLERLSLHPFFYNAALGVLATDTVAQNEDNPLTIGHDVWIGDRVMILSGCRQIGNGAAIAAGSVVTRDVAPYTLVGGVPARPIRTRFDAATIAKIEAAAWWDQPLSEVLRTGSRFLDTLDPSDL